MTNVLPSSDMQAVLRAARARFLLTGGIAFALAGIGSCLVLIPALFMAAAPEEGALQQPEVAQQEAAHREAIFHTRAMLAELAPLATERRSFHEALTTALAAQPEGVEIASVAYRSGSAGTIVLTGTASGRENVNAYREALSDTGAFETVSVPVAALVGALAGNFTITLSGAF
jgi:hypothetical protein